MNFFKKYISFLALSLFLLSCPSMAMDNDEKNNNLSSTHNLSIIIKRAVGPLNLSSCSIDDDLACNIAGLIKDNHDLDNINLNHNKIGNKGIKALAQSLKNSPITHLELYGNPIDDEGFSELFPVLKEVKTLVHMDLRETKLGSTGAYMLSELLNSNPKLKLYHPSLSRDILDKMFKSSTNNQ